MKQINKIAVAAILVIATIFYSHSYSQTSTTAKGYAILKSGGSFQPYQFSRHALGDNEIQIDISYAGICHSDVHHVQEDWGKEEFPLVPGHEIAGRVSRVGKNVTKFKVGDLAGVGCMVNSCGKCEYCKTNQEQYCKEVVLTYHDKDQFHNNETTQGGYSNNIVLTQNFAIKIPGNAQLNKIAPLLCAGITTYSPIRYTGVKKGDKVAVAGFGGLGHMAVQYLAALGADVTVFDITEDKRADAKRLGANQYLNVLIDTTELINMTSKMDFIISTIPAKYDVSMYLKMLKLNGQLCIVGLPANAVAPSITVTDFVMQGNRKVFGSQIGGIKETQEMLDYSVAHNIYPDVETIKADGVAIDAAYKNVLDGKVKYRYVIDMKTIN